MRILYVITSLQTGGAEKLMVDLLPRLKSLGHDVELCVFDGTETPFMMALQEKGIVIHRLTHSPYSLMNVVKLLPLMRKFDVVHTHNTSCQFAAALWSYFCSAKTITTEHNTSNRRRGKWYWKVIDKWLYSRYSNIICISDQTDVNLREHLGNKESLCRKLRTIYNGVDIETFVEASPLDINKEGKNIVVMVAAFRPQKDQDTLVRAMVRLPKDKYELWLVGGGERQDDVKKLADGLGITDQVKFMGVRNDIPSIVKTANVVVLSSHYEGLSLSSIEGMASGKPFVASDVDGLHEIVEGAGILVPHEDDNALAEAIMRLTEDKAYAEQIANACQARAKQYDISVMAERYSELYKSAFYII